MGRFSKAEEGWEGSFRKKEQCGDKHGAGSILIKKQGKGLRSEYSVKGKPRTSQPDPPPARSQEAGFPDDVLDSIYLHFLISQLTRLGTPGSCKELSGAIRTQEEDGGEGGDWCLLQTPRDEQWTLEAGVLRGVRERQEAVDPRAHLESCGILHTPGKQLTDAGVWAV